MARILTKEEWRRRRFLKNMLLVSLTVILFLVIIAICFYIAGDLWLNQTKSGSNDIESITETLSNGQMINEEYLTPNPYSRPQIRLKKVNAVVIHYTANPGTTAENNRSYFEGLKNKQTTSASSHFIIGLEGEIVQCIPLTEESYASNDRNADTISIECCHSDDTGGFNDKTYASLVSLTAALCKEYGLKENDIIRHYDITGKLCPLYFVKHEDAWEAFKTDVMEAAAGMEG